LLDIYSGKFLLRATAAHTTDSHSELFGEFALGVEIVKVGFAHVYD